MTKPPIFTLEDGVPVAGGGKTLSTASVVCTGGKLQL